MKNAFVLLFLFLIVIVQQKLTGQEISSYASNSMQIEFADTLIKGGYEFRIQYNHTCTKAKSQGNTGTCWSFSTISMLESEAMRLGMPALDLSEMFMVRMTYPMKAKKYLRYHGKTNFSPGSLSHDVINIYSKHGALPESVYNGRPNGVQKHNHGQLQKELTKYLDNIIISGAVPVDWQYGFDSILNHYLGEVPQTFDYQGKTYSSKTFAKDHIGVNPSDYLTFTSFTHAPYFSKFVLEIPDNFADGSYLNVPMEDLYQIASHALSKGYTLAWDCDVSEKGFSSQQGLAIVPSDDELASAKSMNPLFSKPHDQKQITAEQKQAEFNSYSLTDDHLMHIVGLAKDQNNSPYFLVKNSWGDQPGFKGFLFASKAYFDLNTISILVHKDGVPDHILDKFSQVDKENF